MKVLSKSYITTTLVWITLFRASADSKRKAFWELHNTRDACVQWMKGQKWLIFYACECIQYVNTGPINNATQSCIRLLIVYWHISQHNDVWNPARCPCAIGYLHYKERIYSYTISYILFTHSPYKELEELR